MEMFRALWAYRGFILGSVKREFQSKYRNSLLGAVWSVLNPLAMIVEQAGGMATDGAARILDLKPSELHQRCPLYIGSKGMVEKAMMK